MPPDAIAARKRRNRRLSAPAMFDPGSIRLRGVRQNNLKGFDLDVPLGRYVVVTGLSGAGKSSLVFETLHAEGQRRYVETFSPYTRQFLELLDKPKVDSIENIRPSIAIQQTNTVKTSRSTVGTMTEIADYAKVWFTHAAACHDPETGERVEDDSPETVWQKARAALSERTVVVAFRIVRPDNMTWPEILTSLKGQGYTRVLVPDKRGSLQLVKVDDLTSNSSSPALRHSPYLHVVHDRLTITAESKTRFLEATEAALHFGQDEVYIFGETAAGRFTENGHYSRGLHSPRTGRRFRAATPGLFSFNSPVGACPRCRGFGRIIDIDYRLAIPDRSLSIMQGAIKPWEGQIYGESKLDLLKFTKRLGISVNIPFRDLSAEHQSFVVDGQTGYGKNGLEWPKAWYGLKGFFRYLETKTYKMHVRVFLSRFRAYNPCPECGGSRLQPEALCWKWKGRTLPELYQMPVSAILAELDGEPTHPRDHQSTLALDGMSSRLRYLEEVGLGYLTLDRASRTLSGGEVQRVNLTTCLGSSLVDTLLVLDEPSVGLHPRDIERLIGIIRSLTSAGNTVVVVEHDEAMIRAADHVIEIGPEPGAGGGHVVFSGTVPALAASSGSITGDYLAGRRTIAVPDNRRSCGRSTRWLEFTRASKHNIRDLSFRLPLNRFVCLSGVSGSGKSTLL
ncbi:MAG TPA: excinuclease ABC subunit A, partial [Opitutaceae bacterium]